MIKNHTKQPGLGATNYPRHVAIIMDGNGRWAKIRGLSRVEGHREGTKRVEEIVEEASELKIGYLTLYAFSKENWARPKPEVEALMQLLGHFLDAKLPKMLQNRIRFNTIGNIQKLPQGIQQKITEVKQATVAGKGLVLTLALSYGGRDEMIRAIRKLLAQQTSVGKLGEIKDEDFAQFLDTHDLPDPDLIIRTSGEHRLSNFLLWQGAYAEFFFDDCLWPDFRIDHFHRALEDYCSRERRFGLISEQVQP